MKTTTKILIGFLAVTFIIAFTWPLIMLTKSSNFSRRHNFELAGTTDTVKPGNFKRILIDGNPIVTSTTYYYEPVVLKYAIVEDATISEPVIELDSAWAANITFDNNLDGTLTIDIDMHTIQQPIQSDNELHSRDYVYRDNYVSVDVSIDSNILVATIRVPAGTLKSIESMRTPCRLDFTGFTSPVEISSDDNSIFVNCTNCNFRNLRCNSDYIILEKTDNSKIDNLDLYGGSEINIEPQFNVTQVTIHPQADEDSLVNLQLKYPKSAKLIVNN